jgi:uncharacterized membrane protein
MADGQGRGRRRASRGLAVLGALLLLIGAVFLYARHAIFDAEGFSDRAIEAVEDERVREPLAEEIVDQLIRNSDPDLVNARPVLVSVTSSILGNRAFDAVLAEAAERAHRTLFTRDGDALVLNLVDGAALAIDGLRTVSPALAKDLPEDASARLNDLVASDVAVALVTTAEDVRFLGLALPALGLLALVLAVVVDRDRRRALLAVALSVAVASGAGLALFLVGRAIVLSQIDEALRDAGAAVWDAYLGDLRTWFILGLGAGLLLAAAVSARRRIDAAEPLRSLGNAVSRPVSARARLARALLILALGVLIVLSPRSAVYLLAVAAGSYAIFFALTELLFLIAPPDEEPAARRGARRFLRPALAAAALVAVVATATAVFLDGDDRERPGVRPAASIERCNGFAELCDRRIDEVVFPGVHNAMSAAEDGFLIANNRKGVTDQLAGGARALLIDAHWGRAVEGRSTVVTDLEAEGGVGKAREQAIEATSEDFVEAAERLIQRQALGEAGGGELGVYFCHVFCELGATPAADLFGEVREFVESHPDEIVLLVVEDYVPPKEIEEAVTESGLIDYVYTPRPGKPLPTLRQMAASGKRVIVMAENQPGGSEVPWYVGAFDYAQETPYTFKSVGELAAKASCDPNRGSPGNPLFQLNHWIEKMPRSPKTAGQVNSFEFLGRRAKLCQRQRDMLPNWIAVDFWEEGDLFEVANELNGTGRNAQPEYAETG